MTREMISTGRLAPSARSSVVSQTVAGDVLGAFDGVEQAGEIGAFQGCEVAPGQFAQALLAMTITVSSQRMAPSAEPGRARSTGPGASLRSAGTALM